MSTAGGLHNPVMSTTPHSTRELRSAIAARKELGDEMEPAVIDASWSELSDGSRTVRMSASGR